MRSERWSSRTADLTLPERVAWVLGDDDGRPLPGEAIVATEPSWWPAAKVVGRHLTPWMADQTLLHA